MGRGYSSCSKEALHRCSLPLGKSLHMREHTVPSALIQIHEHLRVNISTHGGVYTAVRQHASTGRDAPTHTHRHVHRYSRVHRHAHTHLVQAHQNTQRLAPQAHPSVHLGCSGWPRVTQLHKHSQSTHVHTYLVLTLGISTTCCPFDDDFREVPAQWLETGQDHHTVGPMSWPWAEQRSIGAQRRRPLSLGCSGKASWRRKLLNFLVPMNITAVTVDGHNSYRLPSTHTTPCPRHASFHSILSAPYGASTVTICR